MNRDEIERNKKLQNQYDEMGKIPEKYDMQGIIRYLQGISGRTPTVNECLRFNLFLETFSPGKPTPKECKDFLKLLGMVKT